MHPHIYIYIYIYISYRSCFGTAPGRRRAHLVWWCRGLGTQTTVLSQIVFFCHSCLMAPPMVYATIADYKNTLQNLKQFTREDFLRYVKFATIVDIAPFDSHEGLLEIMFLEAFDLRRSEYGCPQCGRAFELKQHRTKSRAASAGTNKFTLYKWKNRSVSDCKACGRGTLAVSAVSGTILAQLATDHWMNF